MKIHSSALAGHELPEMCLCERKAPHRRLRSTAGSGQGRAWQCRGAAALLCARGGGHGRGRALHRRCSTNAAAPLAAVRSALRCCARAKHWGLRLMGTSAVGHAERSPRMAAGGAVLMAVGLGTRTRAPRATRLFAAAEGEAERSRVSTERCQLTGCARTASDGTDYTMIDRDKRIQLEAGSIRAPRCIIVLKIR